MRSVDKFVAGLTPAEAECHKGLIEECRIREKNIQVWSVRAQQAAAACAGGALTRALLDLRESSRKTLDVVSDAALDVSLMSFNMWSERKRQES